MKKIFSKENKKKKMEKEKPDMWEQLKKIMTRKEDELVFRLRNIHDFMKQSPLVTEKICKFVIDNIYLIPEVNEKEERKREEVKFNVAKALGNEALLYYIALRNEQEELRKKIQR